MSRRASLDLDWVQPRVPDKAPGQAMGSPLVVLHTNDIHGQIEGEGSRAGFAHLKAFVEERRRQNGAVLLLDAGDALHGKSCATLSQGGIVMEMMCRVGYDAMVPGNHDFNYGFPRLRGLMEDYGLPVLAANIISPHTLCQAFEGERLLDVQGMRVGIFGLATPETQRKSNPHNTEGLVFDDTLACARRCVERLQKQGARYVICLSHLGMDRESALRDDLLAEAVPGIDLIVGGHSHSTFEAGLMAGDTLIVQAGCNFSAVGEVHLRTRENGQVEKSACLYTNHDLMQYEGEADTTAYLEAIAASNAPYLERPLGYTPEVLVGDRIKTRSRETNFGRLMADIIRRETRSDVAIMNGGGIRCSIPKGPITMREVVAAFPFTNFPVLLEVDGECLLQALEHGLSVYPEMGGRFPQVSGVRFSFDATRPPGQRIDWIRLQDQPLDPKGTYRLAVNDFMAVGGDGYDMFHHTRRLGEFPALSEVLAKHIAHLKVVPKVQDQRIFYPGDGRGMVPLLDTVALRPSHAGPRHWSCGWLGDF